MGIPLPFTPKIFSSLKFSLLAEAILWRLDWGLVVVCEKWCC